MDTLTYTTNEEGKLIKTVVSTKESFPIDDQIDAAQKTLIHIENNIETWVKEKELQEVVINDLIAQKALQTVPDIIQITHTEEVKDVANELRVMEAMVANMEAGATDNPDDDKKIKDAVKNYKDCIAELKK